MNEEKQNEAIFKFIGWKKGWWFEKSRSMLGPDTRVIGWKKDNHRAMRPPYYVADLNKIHEVLINLSAENFHNYSNTIWDLLIKKHGKKAFRYIEQPPEIKAEALLRSLGLWEE